jgi:transcriptional regulator, y4mF family
MKNTPKKESTPFAHFFKEKRRELGITQNELAQRAGVGLRFIRDVEQGKKSLRLNTVNQVLALFGSQAAPVRIVKDH